MTTSYEYSYCRTLPTPATTYTTTATADAATAAATDAATAGSCCYDIYITGSVVLLKVLILYHGTDQTIVLRCPHS